MRHRIKGRKLNRTASHRKALIRNLANQLFEHKEIRTTTAKAKEARITIERLITYAKKGDTHHRRLAFGFLRHKESIKTLFDEIAPAYSERQGGYTRVIKLGRRQGDGAAMAILQLVGFETLADTRKPEKKKKSRKKEEKAQEPEAKVVETKDTKIVETSAEEVKQEEEKKTTAESEQVEEAKVDEKPEEDKNEELVEEPQPVEDKAVEEPKNTEEEKPAEESKPVEEEAAKTESEEKPEGDTKSDDADSEEEKKEK
jgi:large subunit ribosomal protein L17